MNVNNLELGDLVNTGNCSITDCLLISLGVIKPQLATVGANIEMPRRKQATPHSPQATRSKDDVGIYKIDNYRQNQRQTPQNGRFRVLEMVD